jgi:uncharacterized membrane protein
MNRLDRRCVLPTLLLSSVLILGAILLAGGESALRTLLTVWFLVACPGLALAPLVGLRDALGTVTVAIALSIALDTIVAGALIYADAWSPVAAFMILAAITVAGGARQLARPIEADA